MHVRRPLTLTGPPHDPTFWGMAARPNAAARESAFVPEPNVPYAVAVEWRRESYELELEFTPAFVAALRQVGATVDLARGDIIGRGGERFDPFDCKAELERRTGEAAPAWLFRWPSGYQPFVLPRGKLLVDWDDERQRITVTPPSVCTPIFWCLSAPYRGTSPRYSDAAFTPLTRAEWQPLRRQLAPGVQVVAADTTALAAASTAFTAVCGAALPGFRERRLYLQRCWDEVLELSSALLGELAAATSARPQLLARATALLHAPDRRPALTTTEAVAELARERRRLGSELTPTELIVVPLGKHFAAMPEVHRLRSQILRVPVARDEQGASVTGRSLFHSATVLFGGKRFVFMPLDDLLAEQISSRHELYHLLEGQLLPSEVRDRIEAIYAQTVRAAGPFARPYGYLRHEFFATMGEVYEGAFGREGQAWLRRYHRELAALFDEVTGRH